MDTSSEDGYCIHSHISSISESICTGNDGICTISLEEEDQLSWNHQVSASSWPTARVPSAVLLKVHPEILNQLKRNQVLQVLN